MFLVLFGDISMVLENGDKLSGFWCNFEYMVVVGYDKETPKAMKGRKVVLEVK